MAHVYLSSVAVRATLPRRRHHLRHPPDARVARIQVVLLVHGPVAGLDELAVADAHAVPDCADDVAVPGHLQELPVLAARHPRIAFRVEVQRAHQVSHLHRLQEFTVSRIDDDAVILAVTDPDVAVRGIDCEPVCRVELAWSDFVAEPLILELAVLVEMDNPRSADVVRRILRVGVVWALVPMSFADVDVAVRREGDHHRLPQQPLPFRFIPVSAASALADPEQHLSFGTDFRDRRRPRGGDPDVVLGIDRHAVRLRLIPDDVATDLEEQLVIRTELEELRPAEVGALQHPQVTLRVERNRRDSSETWRQHVWIFERVAERLFPLDTLQRLA